MHRLIYKSDNDAKMNWRLVTSILRASTRNNERSGLTGVLLLGKKHFLQVLEGEFEAVNETFQRISHDPRHRRVRIISFDVIDERLFEKWEMRGIGVFEIEPPLAQPLIDKYGEESGELRFPEEGWRALALLQDILQIQDLPEWTGEEPD